MKLLLVDGHYYLYRSFFAIRELRNSRGEPTNAIYAFTKALRKMLTDLHPTHGAVLWDGGIPARRLELQPAYKQQRAPMPDELRAQEEPVQKLCPLLGLPSICQPETEADDLIASFTRAAEAHNPAAEIIIASADKDLLQLVSDRVSVYSTAKADLARAAATGLSGSRPAGPAGPASAPVSASGFVLLGPAAVLEKWGVPPETIADILSLTGDSADNIPGVPGVGEKTAAALLQEFGSLDAILAAPERIAKPALRQKILEARPGILQNREMVRLDEDIPLPVPWSTLEFHPRPAPLVEFLRTCEFRSLLTEVVTEFGMATPPSAVSETAPAPARTASPAAHQTDFFASLEPTPPKTTPTP